MSDDKIDFVKLFGTALAPAAPLISPFNINDRVYKQQTLVVDGYHFTNCAFIQCTINISKGNFSFDKCYFHGCGVNFGGNAQRAAKILALFGQLQDRMPEGLRAEVNPADGAVTVK